MPQVTLIVVSAESGDSAESVTIQSSRQSRFPGHEEKRVLGTGILPWKITRSAAATDFHRLFPHAGSFGNSTARRRILLPAVQIFADEMDASAAKTIRFTVQEMVEVSCFLSATGMPESPETSKFTRISIAAARRQKVKLKIAVFRGFLTVAGGISAPSLEIQKFSSKFKGSAGFSPKPRKFAAGSRSFRFSAEHLNFQRKSQTFR
jgi:hypothetical protein